MSYEVKIVSSKKQFREFMDLPFSIYKGDPRWIAPLYSETKRILDKDRNPYFQDAQLVKFICYQNGFPVARSIIVFNPGHVKKFGEKCAFFGFFESKKDDMACQSLFDEMEKYAVDHFEVDSLEGPFNPYHYSELALLVETFTSPAYFETYNPAYYSELLQHAGFTVKKTFHTRVVRDTGSLLNPLHVSVLENAQARGYTIRSANLFRMSEELDLIREVFNDAFDDNTYFLPLSREEYLYSAKYMLWITNPSLVKIVEYRGEAVGVIQFVLNINRVLKFTKGRINLLNIFPSIYRRFLVDEIVLYAIGVKKRFRNAPAFQLLLNAFYEIARKYRVVYTTWISPDNLVVTKAADQAGLKPYKWFNIYTKSLNNK